MNPHELLFSHIKRFTTLNEDQEQLIKIPQSKP